MSNVEDNSTVASGAVPGPLRNSEPISVVQAAPDEVETKSNSFERVARRLIAIPELGIAIVIIALCTTFFLINHSFLTSRSIAALFSAMTFIGIIAIGQTMLMIAGELDISVGSVAGLGAIVAGYLMTKMNWPIPLAVVGAVAVGALVGMVNGLLAVRVGIPAFIVTLGMLYIAKGVTYLITSGYPIYPLPHFVVAFGKAKPFHVSWAFWIFIGLLLVFQLILSRTVWGRAIYATGGNAEVARIAGIRTHCVKIICYMLTSMLAALAGILQMAQMTSGQPEIGQGWELQTIAGVVIGGVSLFGGLGTVVAAALGVLLMQVVTSGLVVSQAPNDWQTVSIGAIMIIAVAIDLLRRRSRIME